MELVYYAQTIGGRGQGDVLPDGHVGKQVEVLEHHAHLLAHLVDLHLGVRNDGAPFDYMPPLLGIAAMYLAIVIIFTWLQGKLERRLRESDRR